MIESCPLYEELVRVRVVVSGLTVGSVCAQMEEVELRGWIDKLQVRLQTCNLDSPQQLQTVLESLVMKKQSLCETLQHWNGRWVCRRGRQLDG